MGKIEEFLAGCPRREPPDPKKMPWYSFRAFPGFMIHRMYILLSQPKKAIAEFGEGDCKTPFLFFLFFTIILTFLGTIAAYLQWAVYVAFNTSMKVPLVDLFGMFLNNPASLISGILIRTIYSCLFLGISVIILASILGGITRVRSWNPAFTISAYCLPVQMLLFTILAFVQIPPRYSQPVSEVLALAFTTAVIIFIVLIAGYGIIALTKTPVIIAFIVALFWIMITILVTGAAWDFVILPVENGLRLMISQTYFPQGYPTAAILGKNF